MIYKAEYPFKPPKIGFKTKIYHPNIDEKGQVCLPIINAENWKPATKTDQVIQSLVALVNDPEPEHPLRADIAEGLSNLLWVFTYLFGRVSKSFNLLNKNWEEIEWMP